MKRTLIITAIILFSSSRAWTKIIHVPVDQSSIQAAIDAAEAGDTILAEDGTYYENLHFGSVPITLASHFIIDGDKSHISETIIDGSHYADASEASVILINAVSNSKSVVAGFTISGGAGRDWYDYHLAGGIFLSGSGATIRNNIIKDIIVEGNQATAAAVALIPGESDTLYFYENTVQNNVAQGESMGAGAVGIIAGKNSVIKVYDNIISNNKASSSGRYKMVGGGLFIQTAYSQGSDFQVYNNVISNNELHCQSSHGGGIYVVYDKTGTTGPVTDTQVRIFNNILSGNYSEDVGGGIAVWNMEYAQGLPEEAPIDPIIINNTIVNNKASDGSGIFNYDANTLLINNIIWNDMEDSAVAEVFIDDINYCFSEGPSWCKDKNEGYIYLYNNCINGGLNRLMEEEWQGTWEGGWNFDAEPWFIPGSFNLSDSSSCVGNGVESVEIHGAWYTMPELDFKGNPRPSSKDEYPDIGAQESDYSKNDPPIGTHTIMNQKKELDLYPNPTKGMITIPLSSPGNYKLSIFSIAGQVILTEEFTGNECKVDLSGLSGGVYFVTVYSEEFSTVKKLVKY